MESLGPLGPNPLTGGPELFSLEGAQDGAYEGFWALSRQQALALGAPEGPWALWAPYTKGPQGPQRGPGPLVSGALTWGPWGPWGPTPLADSRKKKVELSCNV